MISCLMTGLDVLFSNMENIIAISSGEEDEVTAMESSCSKRIKLEEDENVSFLVKHCIMTCFQCFWKKKSQKL